MMRRLEAERILLVPIADVDRRRRLVEIDLSMLLLLARAEGGPLAAVRHTWLRRVRSLKVGTRRPRRPARAYGAKGAR